MVKAHACRPDVCPSLPETLFTNTERMRVANPARGEEFFRDSGDGDNGSASQESFPIAAGVFEASNRVAVRVIVLATDNRHPGLTLADVAWGHGPGFWPALRWSSDSIIVISHDSHWILAPIMLAHVP